MHRGLLLFKFTFMTHNTNVFLIYTYTTTVLDNMAPYLCSYATGESKFFS